MHCIALSYTIVFFLAGVQRTHFGRDTRAVVYLFSKSLRGGTGGGGADLLGRTGSALGPVRGRGGTAGPGTPFCSANDGGGGGGEPGSPRKVEGGGGGASIPGLPRSLILLTPLRGAGAGGAGRIGSTALFTRSLRGFGTGG